MNLKSYRRRCMVPGCNNNHKNTPQKLFIKIPNDIKRRRIWLNLARRDPKLLSNKSILYFCEDHFNLEQDMENYMEYKIIGSVKKIRMKLTATPSRFDCHSNRKYMASPRPRPAFLKRQKIALMQEIESESTVKAKDCAKLTTSCKPGKKGLLDLWKDKSVTCSTAGSRTIFTLSRNPKSMPDGDKLCITDGNKINNINNHTHQPILNPPSNQIKQEILDFNEDILDSNEKSKTLNTLSIDKREQIYYFHKEAESGLSLSNVQTEKKSLGYDNAAARILYSSSIEINQDIPDSDSETVQSQNLKRNYVERDILMSRMPQSKLNLPFKLEIKKEIPEISCNAETSSNLCSIGVEQNMPDSGERIQAEYMLPDAGTENGISVSDKDTTATFSMDIKKEVLQHYNRDIDPTFSLADIKIKKEIIDSEEESESTLLSNAEIKKEISDSDDSTQTSHTTNSHHVRPKRYFKH